MTHRFRLKMFTESPFAAKSVCEQGVRTFVAGAVMGAKILFADRKSVALGWVLTSTSVAAKFYECWVEDDGRSFACSCAAGTETFVASVCLLPLNYIRDSYVKQSGLYVQAYNCTRNRCYVSPLLARAAASRGQRLPALGAPRAEAARQKPLRVIRKRSKCVYLR